MFPEFLKTIPIFALLLALGCGGGGGDGGGDGAAGTQADGGTVVNQAGGVITPGVTTPTVTTPVVTAPVVAPINIDLRAAMAAGGVLAAAAPPAQDPNKVVLGEALMFDKVLSGNKDISCATCHTPGLGTGDALSLSIGTGGVGAGDTRQLGTGRGFVPRNAPPLYNLGLVNTMFWDGRVESNNGTLTTPAGAALPTGLESALAAQAMFPVTSRVEMRGEAGDTTVLSEVNELANLGDADLQGHWDGIMDRLRAIPQYVTLFNTAYPGVATADLGFEHAANAIAAFEIDRFGTLASPFDQYVAGDDSALSDSQKRGGLLFYGRARCASCHSGALQSDFRFHNIAAPQVGPGVGANAPLDFGQEDVTGNPNHRFRFRTPPLRNVALTGPWMHAGAYTTLGGVVRHYRNPANALRNYNPAQLRGDLQGSVSTAAQINAGILNNLDPLLAPVQLNNNEVNDLVAFLNALTDPAAQAAAAQVPPNVPSGLPVTP